MCLCVSRSPRIDIVALELVATSKSKGSGLVVSLRNSCRDISCNLREDPVDGEVVGNRVHRLAHDRGSHLVDGVGEVGVVVVDWVGASQVVVGGGQHVGVGGHHHRLSIPPLPLHLCLLHLHHVPVPPHPPLLFLLRIQKRIIV